MSIEKMDIYEIALASHLKQLGDRLFQQANQIYEEHGVDFNSRWFPVVYLLDQEQKPLEIGEIAKRLRQTHSAVSKISKVLTEKGILANFPDPADARRSPVYFTESGESLLLQLRPIWASLFSVIDGYLSECDDALIPALSNLEKQLRNRSLVDDVKSSSS